MMSSAYRAQLIKSVLFNPSIHYLSLFKIPAIVARKIISLERRFFWGNNDEKIKLITMAWEAMDAPKTLGELGFGNIKIMSLGPLSKWW